MDIKSIIIGVLFVAVVVLGYLLWDANQNKVKIDLPGVKIEGR
jgi:regulatory protein YycH of two-component signal transduction system YycFG